jgi:16S rRNA (guanine527-N7)-methyltransferase
LVFHVKRRDTLRRYCQLLAAAPLSVTSIRDAEELWRVHVEDALTALDVIGLAPDSLVDVGSGGGAPGIPLAVELGVAPVLLEATARKAAFLRELLAELGLPGEVVNARSEEAAAGPLRDRFAVATARALAPPPVALELCLPLVRPGGRLVLWSGRVEAADLAPVAAQLAAAVSEVRPTGAGRQLVVVDKLGATPERFPRRPGMAGKRPLRSLPSSA